MPNLMKVIPKLSDEEVEWIAYAFYRAGQDSGWWRMNMLKRTDLLLKDASYTVSLLRRINSKSSEANQYHRRIERIIKKIETICLKT